MEPIISYISGSHCTDAVVRLAETGEPFSTLEGACHEAMNKAILSTVMLSIVSYKKVPPIRMRELPAPETDSRARCGVDAWTDIGGVGHAQVRQDAGVV